MGAFNMSKALLLLAAVAIAYVSAAAKCTKDPSKIPEVAIRQELCPASAPFFGFMGCAAALVFACLGAAYGTAKSGVGVANMGVMHADMVMKSIIPIIMAGVLGIYGLIVAVLLGSSITGTEAYGYASYSGYSALAAGLCCGMAGLFVGVILILIFAEALGLYGLIVALILSSNTMKCEDISTATYYANSASCTA